MRRITINDWVSKDDWLYEILHGKIISSNLGLLWKEMPSVSEGQSWTNMTAFFKNLL